MDEIEKFKASEQAIIGLFNQDVDIYEIEKKLAELEQLEMEPEHIFAGGVYIRQLKLEKGSLVIGKRHRHASCNILMEGELSLFVGGGKPPVKISGPLIFESEPNVKKMVYCHTDVVFMNVHPTDKTDIDEIESEFIIPEEEYRLSIEGETKCLGE